MSAVISVPSPEDAVWNPPAYSPVALTKIPVETHTFFPFVPPDGSLPQWMQHHFEYLPLSP